MLITFVLFLIQSCQSVVSDFLSGLPSKHPDNFQKWVMDGPKSNITRRPASYVPTKDIPSQQGIRKLIFYVHCESIIQLGHVCSDCHRENKHSTALSSSAI